MKGKIVFVGGIHGVGKGKICETVCASNDIIHLSASSLIKWQDITAEPKAKLVADISNTQERLIQGLNSVVVNNKTYLLDGHFCLLDKSSKPTSIPVETFEKINPKLLSIVIDKVEEIIARLLRRDNKLYDFDTLFKMQELEIKYAKELSLKLNIPLITIENGDSTELIHLIQQFKK